MKKAFTVNINHQVFYIDEDAYNLLNTYLEELKATFPSTDDAETILDIEAGISEIFAARVDAGHNVITIDDVNNVIERMGRPSDLAPDHDSDPTDSATPPPYTATEPAHKKFYRDERNKVFGGVLAGIAVYTGWNLTILRLLVVVFTLCTAVWPMILIYLLAWMVIPAANTPRQILEMTGQPITVDTLGRSVMGDAAGKPVYDIPAGSWSTLGSALGRIAMAFVGIIGFSIGLVAIICLIAIIAHLISASIIGAADFSRFAYNGMGAANTALWGVMCLMLTLLLPAAAAVWGGCAAIFNLRGPGIRTVSALVIIEILLIITTIVLLRISAASMSLPTPIIIHRILNTLITTSFPTALSIS